MFPLFIHAFDLAVSAIGYFLMVYLPHTCSCMPCVLSPCLSSTTKPAFLMSARQRRSSFDLRPPRPDPGNWVRTHDGHRNQSVDVSEAERSRAVEEEINVSRKSSARHSALTAYLVCRKPSHDYAPRICGLVQSDLRSCSTCITSLFFLVVD
jgi:hypothetical protein